MTVVARMLLKCEERIVMGEWSTGSGGASGPRAAEAGRLLARVDSRTLARLSFPIRPVGPSNVSFLRVARDPLGAGKR